MKLDGTGTFQRNCTNNYPTQPQHRHSPVEKIKRQSRCARLIRRTAINLLSFNPVHPANPLNPVQNPVADNLSDENAFLVIQLLTHYFFYSIIYV